MDTDQLRTWKALLGEPTNYYVSASEKEREIMREWVKGLLREQKATIEFTKATGETRVMTCTLSESVIPKTDKTSERKPNPDVCVVWDTEKNEWRSFRWDRMTRIEFSIG